MKSLISRAALGSLLAAFLLSSVAFGQLGATVPNWTVPSRHGAITTMGDVTQMLPFVGVTPCRIVDTRNAPGPFGGPSMAGGTIRNFALPAGPCAGLPANPGAYSLNITATNTTGPGLFKIWPEGGTQPLVSTLNYVAGQTIANAAIVPAGPGGGITVKAGVSTADLIIDINGFFSGSSAEASVNLQLQGTFPGPVIDVHNDSTSCGLLCGIRVSVVGNGGSVVPATAVVGDALATAGIGIGVNGIANTPGDGSYGVLGQDVNVSQPPPSVLTFRAGVEGTSIDAMGVVGQSQNNAVVGQLRDASNFPSFYGILGATFGTAGDTTVGPWGVFSGGNFGATGVKHFVEPHPTDPKKVILYSTVEGRTVDTTFRGTARLIDHMAVIEVPEDFRIVTAEEGLTVQVTPIGAWSQIYVESEDLNRIVLRGSRDLEFHYQVTGLRRAFKDLEPVQIGYVFMPGSPTDRMPAYLTEEAKRRLISNGTYNADGTVNMETAERAGFTRIWAERKVAAEAEKNNATNAADRDQRGKQQQQE